MIKVSGLTKARGAVRVLEEVSLTAGEGTVTAIVGPSGSGKSTLLRCLNGLETFDQGAVEVAGHALSAGLQPPPRLEPRAK